MLFEFAFEALKESEGIGCRAREAGDDFSGGGLATHFTSI